MKNFSVTFFGLFFSIFSFAQTVCDFPDNPAGDLPPGCLLCGFEYIGTNENYTSNPTDIDFPCGTIENSFFLNFNSDDSGIFKAEMTVSDCSINGGIQVVIFDESLTPVSNCFSAEPNVPALIEVDGLASNTKYVIMGDGFAADICDFNLSIISGVQTTPSQFEAGPITLVSANMSDQSLVCQQTEVCFSIDSLPDATSYFWEISDGEPTTSLKGTSICLKFSTLGNKVIRVSPVENCSEGKSSEIQFEVLKRPSSIYPTSPICPFSMPVEIDGFLFEEFGVFDRPFTTTRCDSFVTYIVFGRDQPVIDIDSIVCKENPVIIGTETFDETGSYRVFIDPGSNILCDTVINLDLTIANLQPPVIECIIDSFLNAVGFRWNEILLTEGYIIIINNDTIQAQKHESFLYFPTEDSEQIRFEVVPFNLTGCHFFPASIDCVGPGTVSTNERNLEQRVAIFPNPSGGVFQLQSDFLIEKTEVFDFSGKSIFSTKENSINLSEQPTGVYFFKIKTKEGIVVKKVVKI